MTTFNCYALFPDAAYLVAQSNCSEHGMDHAASVCKQMGVQAHAFVALPTYAPGLNAPVRTLQDLKSRG